ncbi:MAG: hypothetical protein ABSH33_19580 [Steroidobacteraceae bacterium]|jgi:hypothetical protein
MNPSSKLAARLALGVCGLGGLAWFGVAGAQSAASWSAANLPGTSVYQDRYIDGGSLPPDVSKGDEQTNDTEGLARSLQLDAVASALSSRDGGPAENVEENGFIAKSQWETADYGAWSLDASARAGPSEGPSEQGQGGTLTLRQRGMPFDGGWQADNALGDINTPDINLARLEPRFYLPTTPMQGVTTEWRGPDGLQVVAGGGVPGIFDGIEVPDFRTLDGSTATAGAQWSPGSNWTLGGQFVDVHDVNLAVGSVVDDAALISSSTGLVTAAWQDHNERFDLNLLDGAVNGKPNSVGGWADGSITQGRFLQDAGLFRIDPNMTWGNQLIADDVEGGYYRIDYQGRRWMADVGVDEVHSVSGAGADTTFVTSDARYQLSRDWGVGAVANVSRADGGTAWSLEGYVEHPDSWGTSRTQVQFADTAMGEDATLTVNQAWSTPVGIRLNTSTSVERVSGAIINGFEQDSLLLGLAANGGGQFTAKLGAEGNVNWATAVQGRAAPGVSANVSLTYQISHAWEILATYYDSQTGSWTPLTVVSPLAPPVAPVPAMQERGVFLTLRYKRAAGLHFAPMGGAPGAGSGEISGLVYLDANANGRYEAGEAGAPNVTVVLDGRFSVQTDASGRFDFPVVAAGHHVIKVVSDNLPLPWTLVGEGRTEVDVSTRGRTDVAIAAQRSH